MCRNYWYVSLNNQYHMKDNKCKSVQIKKNHSIVELTREASPKDIDNSCLRYLGYGLFGDEHIQFQYKKYEGSKYSNYGSRVQCFESRT